MNKSKFRLKLFAGIGPLKDLKIPSEIIAGFTLAALAIPEVLGYTSISGTPLVTGLYTMLVPMILFAIFGGSRHLVVGADSATAAMLAAGLTGMAAVKSDEYLALSGLLALMAGVFLIIARIIRLGFLSDFLSRTVLIGFLSGIGIQVTLSQIRGMVGISGGSHGGLPPNIYHNFQDLNNTHVYSLLLSIAVIVVILGLKKISRKIPGALIAVIGFIILSKIFNFKELGIEVLGKVPGGLPHFGLPDVNWSWQLLAKLTPTAFSMVIVMLTQSAATSRAFADRYNEEFDSNKDITGLSIANFGAALSGTFMVNGSPTKTQMVDSAGGRSQLSHLVTATVVLLVLLFFTGPLTYMPSSVLSAIVFLIGLELIDFKGMKKLYAQEKNEFKIALLTTLVVVFVGVKEGILVAMVVSLLNHVRHGYHPVNALIVSSHNHGWKTVKVDNARQFEPGLLVYRFTHSLYYANAHTMYSEIKNLTSHPQPPVKWLCIESSSIDDVDYSSAEVIRSVHKLLKNKGIHLVFSNLPKKVKQKFKRLGIEKMIGKDAFYKTGKDVLTAFNKQVQSRKNTDDNFRDDVVF